jgi:hypothetical protein
MNQYHRTLIALVLTLVVNGQALHAQPAGPALGGPGPEHEKLAAYAGDWDVKIDMGGGPAAMKYEGASESRMIVGKRFLQIEYQAKGSSGDLEGMFTIGFDGRHDHYALFAVDSFGTYFVSSKGKADEATGKIRMLGTDDDPMMKAMGFTKEFVHVLDLRGPDEFAIEIHFIDTRTPERREIKFMEYVFTRKK